MGHLDDELIFFSDSAKNLAVVFDQFLSFDIHIYDPQDWLRLMHIQDFMGIEGALTAEYHVTTRECIRFISHLLW